MPDPVTPPIPTPAAAPTPAPVQEAPKSIQEAAHRITNPPKAAPAQSAPPAAETPAAAQKRLLKAKLDKEEKEYDWDEWTKEQWEKGRAKDVIERDYALDHVRDRTQKEAAKAAAAAWNEFLNEENYDVVAAPGTKRGWKVVARAPATTPAVPTDPLAKEEAELLPLAKEGDVNAVLRLQDIKAERAKLAAIKEWETRQSAAEAKTSEATRYEEAKKWLTGECDRLLAARAKSLEGKKSADTTARLKQLAFDAGEAAARRGENPVEAAQKLIFDFADDLDARRAEWQSSLPTTPPKPEAPPVLGTSPAGGGGSQPKFKDIYEATRSVIAGQRK